MKTSIIIGILLLSILQRADALNPVFLKFISDKGDTTNVFLSDIIKIDTAHNLIEFSSAGSKKLNLGDHSIVKILLNMGNEKWINVIIYNDISEARSDPSMIFRYSGSLFIDTDNHDMLIWGETWKTLASKYHLIGRIPNPWK